MKLHRLGRTSFRAVKSKRDYLLHRNSYNWLYLSRLAALKEFAFMKALGEHGFPVPNAVDCNRHCVIMSLVQGYPLVQVKQLENPDIVFETIIDLVIRLAEHGLIHCDFNEFNIMVDDDEMVTMIDFPQMVSVSHRNAQMYFDRDVECIYKFFSKRFNQLLEDDRNEQGLDSDSEENGRPSFSSVAKRVGFLDKELAASGFTRNEQEEIEKFIEGGVQQDSGGSDVDNLHTEDGNNVDVPTLVSLHLSDQEFESILCNKDVVEESLPFCVSENNDPEGDHTGNGCEQETLQDTEAGDLQDDDATFHKRLVKQRRRAIAAAQGGRKALASRNSYKEKGGKSSQNSKMQRQVCKW